MHSTYVEHSTEVAVKTWIPHKVCGWRDLYFVRKGDRIQMEREEKRTWGRSHCFAGALDEKDGAASEHTNIPRKGSA